MALSGRLIIKNDLVRSNKWNSRTEFMGVGLTQKTLGIIGAGSIGSETIKLSKPFFRNVVAFDPFVSKQDMDSKMVRKVDLDELAKCSDFIVILCNLNDNTRNLVNKDFFNKMNKNAFIINLSRGPVINEEDLIFALENNEIAGAGLDVTTNEPISMESKLLLFKNVIITPHSLCWTDECFHDIATEAIDSILDFIDNKTILNQVN